MRAHTWRILFKRISDAFLFKRNPNSLFWRRLSPQGKPAAKEVLPDPGSKIKFVVPFDFGHLQQAVDQIRAVAIARMPRRRLVLANVPALEPPGAIHRRQPPHHMAEQTQQPTNDLGAQLTPFVGRGAETVEHLPDKFAVTPFILFDVSDRCPLILRPDRFPVTAIGVGGGQLARIGELKQKDQLLAAVVHGSGMGFLRMRVAFTRDKPRSPGSLSLWERVGERA